MNKIFSRSNKLIIACISGLMLFMVSCKDNLKKEDNPIIQNPQPIAKYDNNHFKTISFNPDIDNNIRTGSGTEIEIKKDVFYLPGSHDTSMEIRFNETLPPLGQKIIVENKGKKSGFEPVSGLEAYFYGKNGIVGYTEGNIPVISLLSQVYNPDMYAFYYDSTLKVWVQSAKCEVVFKPKSKTGANNIPLKPVKYDTSKAHFDLEINVHDYPELEAYNGIKWQYAGHDSASDPDKNRWTFSETWRYIIPEPTSDPAIYKITFKNDRTTFITYATPVFEEKDYVKALKTFNSKYKAYQDEMNKKIRAGNSQSISADNLIFYEFPLSKPGKWVIARSISEIPK